nr:glycosyltransferase [Coralloluteibacterium stylophorae]
MILTLGSHGDVQPYVALGRGLAAAGHAPSLCTSLHFEPFVRAHGLEYSPMRDDFVALATSAEGRAALRGMRHLPGTLRVVARLLRRARSLQRDVLRDAWQAVQARRPEVIVFHPKLAGAIDMAHAVGARPVLAPLFPQPVPTAAFPAVGIPDLPLGPAYRRATYRLVHALTGRIAGGSLQDWRRARSDSTCCADSTAVRCRCCTATARACARGPTTGRHRRR